MKPPALKPLSETQRGILMSTMSDASCAMTLGRSAGWVKSRRAAMVADGKATEAVQARCGQVIDRAELDDIETSGEGLNAPPAGAAAVVSSEPPPLPTPPVERVRRAPRQARSPKPEARSPGVRPVTPAIKPAVLRYAAWFLEADWPLKTVAGLFDVDARALLNALDPEGVCA